VIIVVPDDIPVTTPEEEPIVAIPGEPEVHTPPGGVEVRLIVEPTHTLPGPVIAVGIGLTVTTIVAKQPVESV
jgi:hypothetical protein